jgi:hypothetical protein
VLQWYQRLQLQDEVLMTLRDMCAVRIMQTGM